jgi:murein DD-endopeptidase MepM/ murein hydrolase activator NlpD
MITSLALMLVMAGLVPVCPPWSPPVPGPLTVEYAPEGTYGGHWGVDFAAEPGSTVRAPVGGRVSFAGMVAGVRSVTIAPDSVHRVSISYLSSVWVEEGTMVEPGAPLGSSGWAHGRPAVHLSVRVGGRYVDPVTCRATRGELRLVADTERR